MEVSGLLRELLGELRQGYLSPEVRVDLESDECELPTRLSVSLGIVMNELITNAAKYALSDAGEPAIEVTFRCRGEELFLRVGDNGRGFPDSVVSGEERGYGLTIIAALAEQYGGDLELRNERGAVAQVRLANC